MQLIYQLHILKYVNIRIEVKTLLLDHYLTQ